MDDEDGLRHVKNRIDYYKTLAKTRLVSINNLKLKLQFEQFKSRLYENLLKQYTPINISELLKVDENGIKVFLEKDTPITVFENMEEKKTFVLSKRWKKPRMEVIPENPCEEETKVLTANTNMKTMAHDFGFDTINIATVDTQLNDIIQEISKARINKKNISELRKLRFSLLGPLNVSEYKQKLLTTNHRLELALQKKAGTDTKKLEEYMSLSMTSLDKRLIYYRNYYDTLLDIEEIQRYKNSLILHEKHFTRYITFSLDTLYEKIFNYGIVISSVKEILERVLINPNGFNTLFILTEKQKKTARLKRIVSLIKKIMIPKKIMRHPIILSIH